VASVESAATAINRAHTSQITIAPSQGFAVHLPVLRQTSMPCLSLVVRGSVGSARSRPQRSRALAGHEDAKRSFVTNSDHQVAHSWHGWPVPTPGSHDPTWGGIMELSASGSGCPGLGLNHRSARPGESPAWGIESGSYDCLIGYCDVRLFAHFWVSFGPLGSPGRGRNREQTLGGTG